MFLVLNSIQENWGDFYFEIKFRPRARLESGNKWILHFAYNFRSFLTIAIIIIFVDFTTSTQPTADAKFHTGSVDGEVWLFSVHNQLIIFALYYLTVGR